MRPRAIPVLVVAFGALVLAACPGKKKDDTTPDETNRPPKRTILSWGQTNQPPKAEVPQTEVFLQVTEETGKTVSYPVGTYEGACTVAGPLPAFQALTAITCIHNGKGWQLHASATGAAIVVSKLPYTDGQQLDPFTRQEVTSIPVSVGSKVEVAQ